MAYSPVETFLHEAEDLLVDVEDIALDLDVGKPAGERVNQLFRAFHTIKGSGAMCGFDEVAQFTHHVESVLDKVRGGLLVVSQELVTLILAAKDHIRAILAAHETGSAVPPGNTETLIQRFNAVAAGKVTQDIQQPEPGESSEPSHEREWRIGFRPDPQLLACGGNPILLFRDLKRLGPVELSADMSGVPGLEDLQPDQCYLQWNITLRTSADMNAIRDVFLFVEDGSDLRIEAVESAQSSPEQSSEAAPVTSPTAAQPERKGLSKESTVRVPAGRLDRLVNLVGELVMNQSRLAQAASQVGAPELAAPVEEIERLVSELRDNVLGIRMMPIGTIFGRFRRLVHDLSAELGKEIDLVTEGAETELDKSILDQLGEPLIHLLRNSIDHGIEPAARRLELGKSSRGTIRLTAVHTGSHVVISVADDGRGLDVTAIRKRAIEQQLIAPDASLSDKDILHLVLLPGFSTAREVTSVSGRGVGMDVVKRQIDALRGSLSISSEPGKGARFALALPLTLAIIDGLLVQIGSDQFIIPMAAVSENVELPRAQRARNNGRNVTAVRGELIPYVDLRQAFAIAGEAPPIEKIVIVSYEDQRVGLVVDRVLGTHQTVIQSLGKFFRDIDVVSGSTIMGDGRVALILDVSAVVRLVDTRCRQELAA